MYEAQSNLSLKEFVEGFTGTEVALKVCLMVALSGGKKLRTDDVIKWADDTILIHSFRQDTRSRIRHAKGEDDKWPDTKWQTALVR